GCGRAGGNLGPARGAAAVAPAFPLGGPAPGPCLGRHSLVAPGTVAHCSVDVRVASDAAPTVPYFLREPRHGALYRWVGDRAVWGDPFDPPPVSARFRLAVAGGRSVTLSPEVVSRYRDQALGEIRRPVVVVPRVSVAASPAVEVVPIGAARTERVAVALEHAGLDTTAGTVHLDLPPGWADVAAQSFRLVRPEEHRSFT